MDRIPLPQQNYQNLLMETQVFPPVQTLAFCVHSQKIFIEAHEHYQKRSFRNRYRLGGCQGIVELSIPLKKGKNQQQRIADVLIAYDRPWPELHWKAIQSSYGKSAYFIYYKDEVRELLHSRPERLLEFNGLVFDRIGRWLKLNLDWHLSLRYETSENPSLLDLRSRITPKTIGHFPAEPYYQVFSSVTGFLPQLSVLDLLFHLGPDAAAYLQQTPVQLVSVT
ncbi:MAG TPA: WbqC family protein [Saprospiraceae bacterium]|nr:WbqC family protein [Saprospiraceae bacterium]